jgi:signal peptidase I
MQCPSCHFENMPGLDSCGRCGTSLSLVAAAIDVHPPRASRAARRVRRVVPGHLVYRARDAARDASRAITGSIVQDSRVPLPEPGILSRLMVPGWAHLYSGLRIRGWFFLGIYCPLIILGVTRWGTPLGSIAGGLAFSVHAASVMDILIRQGTVRFPKMMAMAAMVSLVLAVLVYLPAGQLLMRVAAPFAYEHDAPPFRRFDVVLINRWAFAMTSPRRGDVVQFRPANLIRRGPAIQTVLHVRLLYEEDELIDRIVGLPGDRVVWDSGTLSVNGEPVSWRPLLPGRLPPHLDIAVPEDRYLILPTTSFSAEHAVESPSFWTSAGLIPREDILGGAFLRVAPITRLWFIR